MIINLVDAILAFKAGQIKRYPCKTNRASGLGYFVSSLEGCLRRGVYERTNWQDKELPDARLQLVFDEGNNQEQIVLRDLAAAGIQIIEQQSAFELPAQQITGHLDGVLVVDGKAVPVEIKSMSPHIFTSVNSFEDFKKKPWTRAYMAQIMLYMLSKDIDVALFILKNKSTGELKQVEVSLDYELAEACLKTAEEINKHVAAKTLPDKIGDLEKCRECPFKLTCCPEINFGVELKISDDPIFAKRLETYLDKKETALECDKEYDLIRERAKATADEKGCLNLLVGNFRLTGKRDAKCAFRLQIEKIAA